MYNKCNFRTINLIVSDSSNVFFPSLLLDKGEYGIISSNQKRGYQIYAK